PTAVTGLATQAISPVAAAPGAAVVWLTGRADTVPDTKTLPRMAAMVETTDMLPPAKDTVPLTAALTLTPCWTVTLTPPRTVTVPLTAALTLTPGLTATTRPVAVAPGTPVDAWTIPVEDAPPSPILIFCHSMPPMAAH